MTHLDIQPGGTALTTAEAVLRQLKMAPLLRTAELPADQVGIYALADHVHRLRYIGMTCAPAESFRKRIHARHRTGSETHSHMFSHVYNVGRMWRDRTAQGDDIDADRAKRLRNALVAEHCRAALVPLDPALHDIPAIEAALLTIAPAEMTAWNGGGVAAIAEPTALVDAMMDEIGFGPAERASVERQAERSRRVLPKRSAAPALTPDHAMAPLPQGPFRFVALDVETANHDSGSICQIGIAFVRHDGSIVTWSTYVDPQVRRWAFTGLHGISAGTVAGAPSFVRALAHVEAALEGVAVYQHSGFDRAAVRAACAHSGRAEPNWTWHDSVAVARRTWPELAGNGGHGLASLKAHLGLVFEHHDAEEDARAAAEVVLRAQAGALPAHLSVADATVGAVPSKEIGAERILPRGSPVAVATEAGILGYVALTQGNIDNDHIYLRTVLSALPTCCIGGSNRHSAAEETLEVDWGHPDRVATDIDGTKKIFRKRGWIRTFLNEASAEVGDLVRIELTDPRRVKVTVVKADAKGAS